MLSDEKGFYKFTTIYPGLYEGRARHIHLKISSEGQNTVVTQLILPYDGDTPTPEDDAVSQGLPNCQIIKGNKNDTMVNLNFDFRLEDN